MSKEDLIQEIVENMIRCQRPASFSSWSKIGMSHAQTGMLFMLSYHGKLRINQIAEYLGVTKSAASQMVDSLIKKELVSRTVDLKDRRIAYLSLTATGQKMMKKIHKLKSAGFRSRLEILSAGELNQLAEIVRKMCQSSTNKK